MRRALELAKRGFGYVNPNPLVGAVIVKDGKVIAEGYHECFGQAHGEVNAINSTEENLEGSTLYVTLEPCCHYGKTPPCVELIKRKKFKKVVVGTLDYNPLVSGKGVKILEESGIEVEVGILREECERLNEIFNWYIGKNRPFVALKWAMTLDGKIATKEYKSKWITNSESREFVHLLRRKYTSTMVGINTVLKDNPDLRCRHSEYLKSDLTLNDLNKKIKSFDGSSLKEKCEEVDLESFKNRDKFKRRHFRIILDSNLRIPLEAKVLENQEESKTFIFTTERKNSYKEKLLKEKGIEVIEVGSINEKVNISEVLDRLGEMKIDSVLVEGGGRLNFSLLENGEVNKLYAFIAPKIFGGKDALSPVEGIGVSEVDESFKLKDIRLRNFKEDILLEGNFK